MILACLLAASLAAIPQDPPHEPTMVERIDALIAKSNAYEGFVARYQLHAKEGHELTLRIVYRSPQEMVIDIQGEGFRSFNRLRASAMDSVAIQDGAPASRASISGWSPSARFARQLRALLDKEFPATLRADDLPACESPIIQLQIPSDNSSFTFAFGLGFVNSARLGWLEGAHRRPERVTLGGEGGRQLVCASSDKLNVFISTENGFVTRIEKRTESGVRSGLDLTSLETVARPADSEFELPELGEGVQDTTEKLADVMEGQAFNATRDALFHTLARILDDGRLKWTDESPARIERLMRAMHTLDFGPVCARLLADEQALIDKIAELCRDRLRDRDLDVPETMAEETEQVEKARQKLEDQLSKFLDREWSQGMPRGKCKVRPSLYEDLGALEKRILSELFAETVTKPVLAAFNEKVAKQLGAK